MRKIVFLLTSILIVLLMSSCSDSDEKGVNGNEMTINDDNLNTTFSVSVANYEDAWPRFRIQIQLLKVPKRIRAVETSQNLDCSFGLGFCMSIGIDWGIQNPHLAGVDPTALMSEEEIIAIYNINETDKKVTFYLPEELTDFSEFSVDDVQEFTVYEDLDMGNNVVLKPGDYNLQFDSYGNFVYVIDMY